MKKLPSLIENTKTRLNLADFNKKSPLLSSLHHFNPENGKTRSKRSDRASNIFTVLRVFINEMDLDSFRWGMWFTRHDGTTDFYTRGINYLHEKTGVHPKTIQRVFSDLERAGYLKSQKRAAIGKDGEHTNIYSLRKLTTKFFRELGFKKQTIEEARAWKRKSNEKKFYSKKISAKCMINARKIKETFKHFSKQTITKSGKPKPSQNNQSKLLQKASYIAEQSGRNPMDVYRELKTNC